ncbi:MAG: dsDNA nuclease domain-containing protein [Parvularculaceae bacterium]
MTQTPANSLDVEDPGDDVARRFRYQHCCAAIYALQLIRPDTNVTLIICENYEDVILQLSDGSFIGIQIKTRDLNQSTFKASDAQIVAAFTRFCILDEKFAGAFQKFEFLTNHAFWDSSESPNNLPYILEALKKRGSVKGLKHASPVRAFVASIASQCTLSEDQIVASLLKCWLVSREDALRSVERDVVDALYECPNMDGCTYSTLRLIAAKLIGRAQSASSMALVGSLLDLYDPTKTFQEVLADQTLAGKRICKKDVEDLIAEAQAESISFEPLCSQPDIPSPDIPKDLERMFEKMDRGRVQRLRIREMENLVRSFETLYISWVRKHGSEKANVRYEDLLSVVRGDCTEARVATEPGGEPFGPAMYDDLRARAEKRCAADPVKVYQCRPEHLIGAAGLVTQKCQAWWSEEFDLSEGSS